MVCFVGESGALEEDDDYVLFGRINPVCVVVCLSELSLNKALMAKMD